MIKQHEMSFIYRPNIPDTLKERVLTELLEYRGQRAAITSKVLAARLGTNPRAVRKAIELLVADGELIGASVEGVHGGYFMIQTKEELEMVRAVLRSRAASIFRRDACLRWAWEREYGWKVQPLLMEVSDGSWTGDS